MATEKSCKKKRESEWKIMQHTRITKIPQRLKGDNNAKYSNLISIWFHSKIKSQTMNFQVTMSKTLSHISCHWPFSTTPENIRKPEVEIHR